MALAAGTRVGPFAGRFAIRAGDVPAAERHLQTLEEVAKVARGPLVPYYRDALMAEVALARGRPSEAQTLLENALGSGKLHYDAWVFEPGPAFARRWPGHIWPSARRKKRRTCWRRS